ncbi:MAG: ABC transporter permease [Corynebacterium sp.]|uniref:ABC transporter permease n=1 Tax=Corynebacterium sp. TaxID=1720 RepID=UPI0026DDC10A|nr:ABC transporter permease [Corynebacterium sp.]MDO4762477.1 ABC transporter permease [Corynebacterium sp.]
MNFSLLRSAWITAKVAARSTGAFANARTFLVGIVLTPLLGVAFNVLLGQGIGAPELMPIAWASLVLGVFGMSASTLNGIVVHDRMIGVFDEIITRNRIPFHYWLGISLPSVGTALVTGSILSATFLLITGEFSYHPFAYLVVPSAILGALFGVFCAGMGVDKDNPYTYLNWSLTFLPLTSGAVVPLALYPTWIAPILQWVPLTALVQAWRENTTPDWAGHAFTWVSFLILAIIGLSAAQRYGRRLRAGYSPHML